MRSQKPNRQKQIYQNEQQANDTPLIRSQVSKLRDTLKTLQQFSNGDKKKNIKLNLWEEESKEENIGNSRNINNNQLYLKDLQDQLHIASSSKQTRIKSALNHQNLSSDRSDPQSISQNRDYMFKLDLMKQRLQQICYKNQNYPPIEEINSYNLRSPQSSTFSCKNKKSQNNKIISIGNSRQSTTRDNVNINHMQKRNKLEQKRIQQINNDLLLDEDLHVAKNTVPMPTIIHEDEIESEDYRGSTSHLNSHYQQIRRNNQKNKKSIVLDSNVKIVSSKNVQKGRINSYEAVLSLKKNSNKSQDFMQLYPSMSEQLDMKIYKKNYPIQPQQVLARSGSNSRYQREQINNSKYAKLKKQLEQLQCMRDSSFINKQKIDMISNNKNNLSGQPTKRRASNHSLTNEVKQKQSTKTIQRKQKYENLTKKTIDQESSSVKLFLSKIHRANIQQIIFSQNQNNIELITGSGDYSVKFHQINSHNQIFSHEINRHRSAITSLTRMDSLLLTTSKDFYLKYYKLSAQTPPTIEDSYMYKFNDYPTQLACTNETNVLIGTKSKLYLFDLTNCQITKQITVEKNSKIIQNSTNLFIGTYHSLSLLDVRLSNSIVSVNTNLPNVQNWIVHPFENIFLMNSNNKILRIDPRLVGTSKKITQIFGNLPPTENLIDHNWNYSTSMPKLSLLTHQINATNQYCNKLTQLSQFGGLNGKFTIFPLSQQGVYMSTAASSMNIVREFQGHYYLGDKSGNLHVYAQHYKTNTISHEKNKRRPINK